MYRTDFSHVLHGATTYGLGIAWGAELTPQPGEILLASPDAVGDALSLWGVV
jgi:hypothetical protein